VANVLIAGCGYVGTALARELMADGNRVWGLRRAVSQLPAGIEPIPADLNDPRTLSSLPRAVDCLVYCASADESSDAAYMRAYVSGLQHLLDALTENALQHIFFTSSTGVYAQSDGEWVDEASVTTPTRFSGVRLLEAENLLRNHAVSSTVLRCSGIYGPGRTRLIDSVRQGTAQVTQRYTNRIHRDDVAGAIAHLLRCARQPELLILSDDDPAPENEVALYLAQLLGVTPPLVSETADPARGAHKRCRNHRLAASGYRLRYPSYREGYAAMLAPPTGGTP
jgi:nucleoside-diphosphate-sugar epimerase